MENRLALSGWMAAALLAGLLAAGGFQGTAEKFAVVDIAKAIEDSNFGKANQEAFKQMKAAREGLLEFVDNNRVLTNEQAQRLRELSTKPTLTDPEKAELERIKADVVASAKRSQELSNKPNITPEERTLLEEYSRRSETMERVAQRWYREFYDEMQDWADKQKAESYRKAREAVAAVAKAQGYTLVFEAGVAPYGANDLTQEATQALNAQK